MSAGKPSTDKSVTTLLWKDFKSGGLKAELRYTHFKDLASTTASYTESGYSCMTHDTKRNRIYEAGIADFLSGVSACRILEVGPGADACLTKMVLRHASSFERSTPAKRMRRKSVGEIADSPVSSSNLEILCIEGNPGSAESARKTLTAYFPDESWRVLHGMSTSPIIQPYLDRGIDVVLQEIIGYVGSKEGVAAVVDDLQRRVPDSFVVLPPLVGTFYAPTYITHDDVRNIAKIGGLALLPQTRRAILAQPIKMAEKSPVWPSMGCLEWLNLNKPVSKQRLQTREATFTFEEDTLVNSLTAFIWCAFTNSEKSVGGGSGSSRAPLKAVPRRFENTPPACKDADVSLDCRNVLASFSSLYDIDPYTSSWPNLVVFFPKAVKVKAGDYFVIYATSDMRAELPEYSWKIHHFRKCRTFVKEISIPVFR